MKWTFSLLLAIISSLLSSVLATAVTSHQLYVNISLHICTITHDQFSHNNFSHNLNIEHQS